jgi:hypothetical protein
MTGGILALDLGARLGWAYGLTEDEWPSVGIWKLKGSEASRFASLEKNLILFCNISKPRTFVLEAPLVPSAMSNDYGVRAAYGYRAIVLAEVHRRRADLVEQTVQVVRTDRLGANSFPKGAVKHEVVNYWRRRGFLIRDHNAADAALLWEWYRCRPLPLEVKAIRKVSISALLSKSRYDLLSRQSV